MNENYSQTSARRGRPRSYAQARALAFNAKGEKPAEPVLCLDRGLSVKKCAFTMAEILLSLTIIGVVAAITLPSLTGNINERTWNTQRKALYARFSQAIALMPALNGYGTLTEETDSAGSTSIEDTAAETFVTDGLAKVLKINNICDNEHLEDCGLPEKITPLAGSAFLFPKTLEELNSALTSVETTDTEDGAIVSLRSYSMINTKAAAFETANGESIAVYYNPKCISSIYENEQSFSQLLMCANFIYDLNGSKGPNTIGKDIGVMTALYPTDTSVVAPDFYHSDMNGTSDWQSSISACKSLGDEYRLPNKDEAAAMFFNRKLLGNLPADGYWTSTVYDSERAWVQGIRTGTRYRQLKTNTAYSVRCVKR